MSNIMHLKSDMSDEEIKEGQWQFRDIDGWYDSNYWLNSCKENQIEPSLPKKVIVNNILFESPKGISSKDMGIECYISTK